MRRHTVSTKNPTLDRKPARKELNGNVPTIVMYRNCTIADIKLDTRKASMICSFAAPLGSFVSRFLHPTQLASSYPSFFFTIVRTLSFLGVFAYSFRNVATTCPMDCGIPVVRIGAMSLSNTHTIASLRRYRCRRLVHRVLSRDAYASIGQVGEMRAKCRCAHVHDARRSSWTVHPPRRERRMRPRASSQRADACRNRRIDRRSTRLL